MQAALALAVAEKAIEFEHRDLHWGNILISRTNESHVYYQLGQQKVALISKGVKVRRHNKVSVMQSVVRDVLIDSQIIIFLKWI